MIAELDASYEARSRRSTLQTGCRYDMRTREVLRMLRTLGKISISLSLAGTAVGAVLADWNRTHVFNPDWAPHARFHEVSYLALTVGMCVLGLWLVWRRSREPWVGMVVAAAVPLLAVGSFFLAELVPGAHFEDHHGAIPRYFGIPANFVSAGLACLGSFAGLVLYGMGQHHSNSFEP